MNASERIDQLIAEFTDWRGKTLASVRKTILAADPDIVEEWKWMGSPVWSRDGMIAVGNAHKDKVKLTFSNGARLPDPDKLFNAGLDGGTWRAIDLFEGDKVDDRALKNLVRAAIDYNQRKSKKKAPARPRAKATKLDTERTAEVAGGARHRHVIDDQEERPACFDPPLDGSDLVGGKRRRRRQRPVASFFRVDGGERVGDDEDVGVPDVRPTVPRRRAGAAVAARPRA